MNFKTYTVKKPQFMNNLVLRKRKQIYNLLSSYVDLSSIQKILDVGVTTDQSTPQSNFLEALYPHPERIIAFSDQDASWMEKMYPGLRFVQGDGCNLPFPSSSIDMVFSSAVIEHVGSFERQKLFISECIRVASRYVFVTTPNRWYPVEFHTVLPLIHWLPKSIHRSILKLLGAGYLAKEDHLNLLSRSDLRSMITDKKLNVKIGSISLLGIESNLIVFIDKGNCV